MNRQSAHDQFAGVYTAPVNSSNIDVAATTITEVREAAFRIQPYVHRTPLLTNKSLSDAIGVEVRLKCENLQRAGSFKIRGAMNALLQLSEDERRNGVVAFSSGNHAQGVALAAKLLGMKATIVMPEGSVASKVAATEAYGATVVTAGVTSATRDTIAREIAGKTGAVVLPPFDDWRIIAGAGTVGLEIVEEWPEVETIVTPLGGGGLLSGTAIAATSIKPSIDVYGVEPRAGNDGEQSFKSGRIVTIEAPKTIADGARTLHIGERNFAVIRERVRDIVSVEDDVLLDAVKFAMYRTKLVIEPTGALGIAALLSGAIKPKGKTAIVVSGGNLDFKLLCH
ncbi:MAG: threo-3-hydroxy-L-aspartate ammonia-lyase [Thermoanaerobaculia bacterium]|jgi:threonine dehydratase|nr:threo-3-hydroxy-L-aspartate ammonia-lyase [Thermoanaerobaculia bacterium]